MRCERARKSAGSSGNLNCALFSLTTGPLYRLSQCPCKDRERANSVYSCPSYRLPETRVNTRTLEKGALLLSRHTSHSVL